MKFTILDNDLSTSSPPVKLLQNLNYSFKRLGARTVHTVFVPWSPGENVSGSAAG